MGIELRSIIPKPLSFQHLTDTYHRPNRRLTGDKHSFGCKSFECYPLFVRPLQGSGVRQPSFAVLRGKFDRIVPPVLCPRFYECLQIRNTEAEMDPPCAVVFKLAVGVNEMEYGVASIVITSRVLMDRTKKAAEQKTSPA
jgi:hypothetical protein